VLGSMQQLHTYITLRDVICKMLMVALFFFRVSQTGYTTCVTRLRLQKNHADMYTRTYIHLRLIARAEFESSLGEARMHRACCL
jgi:hypothetical protein